MDLNSQSWRNSACVLFSEISSTSWTRSVCARRATRMSSVDAKKLTAQVAARHGLLIREDDPAMALVTMSEIVLEQVLENAQLRLRGLVSEAEKGQKRS